MARLVKFWQVGLVVLGSGRVSCGMAGRDSRGRDGEFRLVWFWHGRLGSASWREVLRVWCCSVDYWMGNYGRPGQLSFGFAR